MRVHVGTRIWRLLRPFKCLFHRNPTRCGFCGAPVDMTGAHTVKGFDDYFRLAEVFCNSKHWIADWKAKQKLKEAATP
jgi:hypothetical protein